MRKLLRNCVLYDPEAASPESGSLVLEAGRIAARLRPGDLEPADAEVDDLAGRILAPGFIDLHFHGSAIFHEPGSLAAALAADAASCVRHGTTAFLATTVAEAPARLRPRVQALGRAIQDLQAPGAVALGVHLEGPWINPGAAGAQPADGIHACDSGEAADLMDLASGWVRMVTLAPELEGALDLIELLAGRQVVAALGHSLASAHQVDDAVARGARHVTHLFNAMGPLHHRAPGLAGAALSDDRLSCDLICDGCHVDPRMTRLAARVKGPGLMLITDRIEPPESEAGFGAGALHEAGGAWRLADGRLAASRLHLDQAVSNAVDWGAMTHLDAVAACTLHPARLLGLESERGTLRVGARADLTALDATGRAVATWVGGEVVHRADR